jgi:hypothetical protein
MASWGKSAALSPTVSSAAMVTGACHRAVSRSDEVARSAVGAPDAFRSTHDNHTVPSGAVVTLGASELAGAGD